MLQNVVQILASEKTQKRIAFFTGNAQNTAWNLPFFNTENSKLYIGQLLCRGQTAVSAQYRLIEGCDGIRGGEQIFKAVCSV